MPSLPTVQIAVEPAAWPRSPPGELGGVASLISFSLSQRVDPIYPQMLGNLKHHTARLAFASGRQRPSESLSRESHRRRGRPPRSSHEMHSTGKELAEYQRF